MSTAVIGYMPMPVNFEYRSLFLHGRPTYCDRRYLSEEEHTNLDRKLSILRSLTRNSREVRKNRPQISVEYFSPCRDRNSFAYGTGGIYETVSGICRKIDDISGTITIGETVIPLDDIISVTSPLFGDTEDDIS